MTNKEKIKQKLKELETLGKELEALLEEPKDKPDTDFKLELNTGGWRYVGGNSFYFFITEEQSMIAKKRKSAQDELLQIAFILNGDWKPDWKNSLDAKYYIYYDYDNKRFCSNYNRSYSWGMYFKFDPLVYFLATASDNLKAYLKGELQ